MGRPMTISQQWQPRHPGISLAELTDLRAAVIQSANAAFEPTISLIDILPRGRHGDQQQSPGYLRCRGIKFCLLGFRDVVENPGWLLDAYLEEMHDHCDAIRDYTDPVIK
jgi:predicted glycosyltransferase